MDFLNKAVAQLTDLFKSMTPGARITSALLLAVVIISVGYLFTHEVTGGDTYLMGERSFSADELPEIEAALGKAGLPYEVVGARISIRGGRQHEYMAALSENNALPLDFGDYLLKATQSSPWAGRDQLQNSQKVAKQLETASILRKWQGIEQATVMYDVQKKSGFGQRATATAAVSIRMQGDQPLDEVRVPSIQRFVASALGEGLAPENVTVADHNTSRSYGGTSAGGIVGVQDDAYLQRMRAYKEIYESAAKNALSYVPGVSVVASVELQKEQTHEQVEDKIDPKAVAIYREESTQNSTTEGAGPAGRPGLASQGPNGPARLTEAASGPSSTQEGPNSTVESSVTGRTHTKTVLAPLTPKTVKFLIGVPSEYYKQVWRERNQQPDGSLPATAPDALALQTIEQEIRTQLQDAVRALVPNVDATVDPTPLVTVTSFASVALPEMPAPSLATQATAWLSQSWSTLGMMGLAAFSLVMLRSMVKSTPAAVESPQLDLHADGPSAQPSSEPESKTEPPKPKNRLKRRTGDGASLKEDLVEMVREDPDGAATILRGWIGNAN